MSISPEVLRSELDKARRRCLDQQATLSATAAIVESPLAAPTLKRIAAKRLPKLKEILSETLLCITELEKALNLGSQSDLLDTKPSPPATPKP